MLQGGRMLFSGLRVRRRMAACFAILVFFGPIGSIGARELAVQTEQEALQRGAGFERSRQWLEAIETYDLAVEQWPENAALQYGLRRAKVHFSIDRRYSDRSFLENMLPLPESEALSYLDDLLERIRQHYVEPISMTSVAAHGTESLYLALNNDRFLERNLPRVDRSRVASLRESLKSQYWNRRVSGEQGARQLVQEICRLAAREASLQPGAVVMEFVFGGCNALDDYSGYLTAGKLNDLYGNIDGEFVGIGIEMKAEQGRGLRLVDVLADSPADEGGLKPGEYIVAVERQDCRTMNTEEAAALLQGKPGSFARLTIENAATSQTREVSLHRRAVKVKSIPLATIVDPVSGIGYIRMTGFQKTTAVELDAALLQLQRDGMQALIWDLRGNPGGLLTAAVEVLDRFIDDGVLVSTKGRTSDQNWTYTAKSSVAWRGPMVLLVDSDSASASEIVAGCLKDHARAEIVGRKTYGKWSVQSILPGRAETGLRITTARFYSPSGRTYGKIGIEPDIQVPDPTDEHVAAFRGRRVDLENDRDLDMAIQRGRQKLAQARR